MKITEKTEQEKRDLIIRSLDKNMFVEAGAGAGKTTIMVSRIIRQLMSGVDPGQIVAITFTNAATRELRGRILDTAQKVVTDPVNQPSYLTGDEDEIEHLRKALPFLDRMQISTIHSFCYRILSERMFEAELPVGFGLVEEVTAASDKERLFKLWAEGLKKEDWEKLLPVGKYRSGVAERIKYLAMQLDSIPRDMNVHVAIDDMSEEEVRNHLKSITDEISKKIICTINDAYKLSFSDLGSVNNEYLSAYGIKIKNLIAGSDLSELLKGLITLPKTKGFAVKPPTKEVMDKLKIEKKEQADYKENVVQKDAEIRDYLVSKLDEIKKYKAGYENSFFRPFIKYAEEACEYWRKKLPEGYLTNDTLLSKTEELLGKSKDAYKFLANKFRYIYVDEFQDTDHMQENFIRRLASDPDNAEKLRDGALFVVGDPKQSIYRFRGAEPEVYFEAKKRMEVAENALVVELADNYRSNDRLIEWINNAFASKNITQGHPYTAMNVIKKLPDASLPNNLIAGVYNYMSPEDALSADEINKDAESVCRLILTLVNKHYLIADYKNDGSCYYRNIRYSDFLILSMNTPGMENYKKLLNEHGIPVEMDSKTNLKTERELNAFARIYAFIATPFNRKAREGAIEALYVLGLKDMAKNEQLTDTIAKDTEQMSAYGALSYLVDRPELYMPKDCDIADHRIYDVQSKIIQMKETMEAGLYGNKCMLSDAIREYCEGVVEHELIMEKDSDAVRFMNLHKAKGLEGEIVIWTNRAEDRSFRDGPYRCGMDYYPTVRYKNKEDKFVTEWCAYGGDASQIRNAKTEDECESIRLEYVAATRAKQALIFMDRYNAKPGNMFSSDYKLAELPSVKEIVDSYDKNMIKTTIPARYVTPKVQDRENENKLMSELRIPVFSSESPSDYEDESTGKMHTKGAADNIAGMIPRPTGATFGTVMHRAFELIVDRWVGPIEASKVVPTCIDQAINENIENIPEYDVAEYKAFLTEAVNSFGRWFMNSDIKKRAKSFYTELPFSYVRKPEDPHDPEIWMHGEADLVARLDDGSYYVLDYKSDNDLYYPDEASFEDRLRGKYSPQIDAYKKAVSRAFNVSPDRISASLVSFSQKELNAGEKLRVRITDIQ